MRSVRTLACISAAVMLLGACGNDSSSSADGTIVAAVSAGAPAAVDTTSAISNPTTIVGVTPTNAPLSGPVQIDVLIGVDSSPDRVERVTVGAEITLNITNPNAADEFHVHGIDIEQAADAGQMATINFTIDAAGVYAVESHVTQDVFVVIEAT